MTAITLLLFQIHLLVDLFDIVIYTINVATLLVALIVSGLVRSVLLMKKQYILSERAHFMCPNMHFGMLMEIEKEYDKQSVDETLLRMAEAHPF